MGKGLIVFGDVSIDVIVRARTLCKKGHDATVEEIYFLPGGSAANCAVVASGLGLRSTFVGATGCDDWSDVLSADLRKHGVNAQYLRRTEAGTGVTVAIISADGERTLYSFRGANASATFDRVPSHLFDDHDCLLVSGYSFQDEPSRGTALALIGEAERMGLRIALDPSFRFATTYGGPHASWLSQLDYIFPNRNEAHQLTGTEDPFEAAAMIRDWGIEVVVIKLDMDGCFVATQDTETLVPAYPADQIVDAIGAGDAFCGGFLAATLMGFGEVDAARIGNAASVRVVEQVGGHEKPPTMADVVSLLEDNGDRQLALSVAQRLDLDAPMRKGLR